MTTSGVYDFDLSRNQIIRNAFLKIGGIDPGEQPTPEQYSYASDYLNMIVENLRGDNCFIWEMEFKSFYLTPSSVVLGTDGNNYECIRNHVAEAANRPVSGAEYLTFWKLTSSGTPSAWVIGTTYTSICNIPMTTDIIGLSDLRMRQSNNSTIYMNILSRQDYQRLSQTITPGQPLQYYYYKSQTTPSIFLYPYPNSTNYLIEGYQYKYPQYFANGNDTPSFLREWLLALTNCLAFEIGPIQGIFGQQLSDLKVQADISLQRAKAADHEYGPTRIQPNLGPRRSM